MKHLLPILFLFLTVQAFGQEVKLQGHVQDAKTGELLPYANIYVAAGRGTLTNAEGDFRLSVEDKDVLTFSYIGYEKLKLKAADVPKVVKLKPFEQALKEIVVKPIDKLDILKQVINNLKQDFSKHKKDRQGYFMRALLENKEDTYLIESLMAARSAINLREEEMLSGRTGLNTEGDKSSIALRLTNIQRTAEIGPSAFMSDYWEQAIKPLNNLSTTKNYYDTELETLLGNEGEKLYRIVFRLSDKKRPKWHEEYLEERRHIVGTAFVDAKTIRLLRFQGKVENAFQNVNWRRQPTDINFQMSYDYSHGYASVNNLAVQGGNEGMKYKVLLYNIHDDDIISSSSGFIGENVLNVVDNAGFDSTLWEKYNIVKRTEEEEIAFFGETERNSPTNKKQHKTPKVIHYPDAFSPLMEHLISFAETIPQEKVYVHLDNTCYFQGDTIWFTAYTRQTNTDKPSEMSGVLYVELLNNDGYLVERKLIEMQKGRGNGFFALNNHIQYSGFYELRAYTRWQLNWGEHEHQHPYGFGFMFRDKAMEREFFRDYDKLYSRVFPVYDKPLALGDYTRDMTLRVMRREFKNDPDKRKLTLSLFPEGGNLIAGVENRVAFEAAMTDGEQVEGILTVGKEQIKTFNRGRGVFSVVPQNGMEREVTFVATNGEKVSAKLPKPDEEGATIRVTQKGDSVFIETNLSGLNADSLAFTIMHEGKVEEFHALVDGQSLRVGNLDVGIHQVTLFDTQGHVFSDRLFFVTKPDLSKPTLTVSGLKDESAPYEKIELKVKGKGGDVPVSLAVRDAYQSDPLFDNGNIMTEMLLSSEVKGFIPNPGWYFEKDDEEHRLALDLLMMTQGWRRFVWRDMAVKGEWDLTQPREQTPVLRGYVYFNPDRVARMLPDEIRETLPPDTALFFNRYVMPNPQRRDYKTTLALAKIGMKPGLLIHAELTSLDTKETFSSEEPFKGDYFQLLCPKFYGEKELFLSVADPKEKKKRKKKQWIELASYGDETDYRTYISWPYPRFVQPYSFYQSHMQQRAFNAENEIPAELLDDSTKALRQVSVTARRRSRLKAFSDAFPAFAIDAYDAWNAIEDAGVPIFNYVNVANAIVRVYMNDYGVNEEKDGNGDSRISLQYGLSPSRRALPQYINIPADSLYHPKYLTSVSEGMGMSPGEAEEYFGDGEEDPRFLLDKFVIYTDYQPRLEGSNRYRGSNRPETRIAVYPLYDGGRRAIYRDRRYILPGFAASAEFYHPDYSQQTPPEPTDYRRTLYWNPHLQLDKNGEANITFYNNSRQTTLSVEAEGQAPDGTLLWTK